MAKIKKKRLKIGKLFLFLAVVFLSIYLIFSLIKSLINIIIVKTEDGYIASDSLVVRLYDLEYKESIELVRGTKIVVYEKEVENNDITYKKIK